MKFLSTLFICLVSFLTLWGIIPTGEECEIYDSAIRLHVIANSDGEDDQKVKLMVRDAILEHIKNYDASSKEDALSKIYADKNLLESTAKNVLAENGFDYNASLVIGEESYPERTYDTFSLPAGEYTSVRIILGDGEGKNWWCVLFPPLCTAYATEFNEEDCVSVGLSKDQYRLITGTDENCKVKFKILEMASEAFSSNH